MTKFSELSGKHFRLLKEISTTPLVRTQKNGNEDIDYLANLGLIKIISYNETEDYYYQPVITEKGKAFLYAKTKQNIRTNITLGLSIFATILSILNAFTPFPDWCKQFLSSLFT